METTITIATVIIALAAAVQAGAAFFLFRVTKQYVHLTHNLVEGQRADQLTAANVAIANKRSAAVALRRHAAWVLDEVSGSVPHTEVEALRWIKFADELEAAAHTIGGDVALSAQWAATAIRTQADARAKQSAASPVQDLIDLLAKIDQLFPRLARTSIQAAVGASAAASTDDDKSDGTDAQLDR